MQVALLANPRSGSGRARALADQAHAALTDAGVRVLRADLGPGLPPIDLARMIAESAAAVVAGGDGTVRSVASACIQTGTPLYHVPAGNENLFAREFGMTRRPATLLAALRRGRTTRMDVCRLTAPGGWSAQFLLMASIGPDAGVVHRLHASRKAATGHAAYLFPVLEEFRAPSLPRLTIACDGRTIAQGRGMVVIGNIRRYALDVNPCRDACCTDGQLDVTFIPAETAVEALYGLARLRARWPAPEVVHARGHTLHIATAGPGCLQIDGEADCSLAESPLEVSATVQTHPVPVLVPPQK